MGGNSSFRKQKADAPLSARKTFRNKGFINLPENIDKNFSAQQKLLAIYHHLLTENWRFVATFIALWVYKS